MPSSLRLGSSSSRRYARLRPYVIGGSILLGVWGLLQFHPPQTSKSPSPWTIHAASLPTARVTAQPFPTAPAAIPDRPSSNSALSTSTSVITSPTTSVTTVGSVTLTAQWTSSLSIPAGLPASVQITATQNGSPLTGWYVQSYGNSALQWTWDNPLISADTNGQWIGQATSAVPLTANPTVTVLLPPTITTTGNETNDTFPSVTITLPPITFAGPSASAVPNSTTAITPSAWWFDQAWDAWPVLDAVSTPPTIAVLTDGHPNISTINAWLVTQGLPKLTVTVAPGFSLSQAPSYDNQAEATTDLTALGIAAPGAHIVLYPFTDYTFSQTFLAALANPAVSTLSISYTIPVSTWSWTAQQALLQQWEPAVTAANARGTTVFVAAGDQGSISTNTEAETPAFSLLDTLPNVTVVGGVDWTASATGSNRQVAYWGGTAYAGIPSAILQSWVTAGADAGHLLGGGGETLLTAEPPWQSAVVPDLAGRGTPDLSGPASRNYPSMDPSIGGSSTLLGGTSFATPLTAGWLAECGQADHTTWGNLNPALYALAGNPSVFEAPLFGNNGTDQVSTAPWNALTGLGAPWVAPLCQALQPSVSSTQPVTTTRVQSAVVHLAIRIRPSPVTDTVCATATQAGHPIGAIPMTLTTQGFPLDIGVGNAVTQSTQSLPQLPGATALTGATGSACWPIYPPSTSQHGWIQVQAVGQTMTAPIPSVRRVKLH